MTKQNKKITAEFTQDELNLLSDICLEELFTIGKLQYQRFVDRVEVTKRVENLKKLMDKITNLI